jgi:hypothetical protein
MHDSRGRDAKPPEKFSEKKVLFFLCIFAALHVFVFSAAFPFFNNVDEPSQFDLLVKYSHGHIPRGQEFFSKDSSAYLTLFSSCAYMGTPDMFPDHKMPAPLWTEPVAKMQRDFELICASWQVQSNYEVSQAPLYYSLAGSWWSLGRLLGFHGGRWLFSLHFLNIFVVITLVLLGYRAAATVFPERPFVRLGVAAFLAFLPNETFYSIENDILSSLSFGLTFICVIRWLREERPTVSLGVLTGLSFAATYLTKATNLPLLGVVIVVLLMRSFQILLKNQPGIILPAWLGFLCSAIPPIASWMIWCHNNYGDLTGARLKMEALHWTLKPMGQWWGHPIFMPFGMWTYLLGQLGTFWQGEFLWHGQPLAWPFTNTIYTLFSLVLIGLSIGWLYSQRTTFKLQHQVLLLSAACVFSELFFFAGMSAIYDFGDCPNPSREHPYFAAGRMMLGALIPFILLIVFGLDLCLTRLQNRSKYYVLAVIMLSILALETATAWPVFFNEYNWFHLP